MDINFQESQQLPHHEYEVQNILTLTDHFTSNYKFTLRNVWESLKDFITKVKDQLKTLSQTIKQKILVLTEDFEKRLHIMRNEFQKIMKEALVIGEDIKECLQVKSKYIIT